MTIIGAGGGGSVKGGGTTKTRRPSEAKDSLDSTAYAKVIDLLCEGEIEGFPSARDYSRDTDNYNTALLKDVFFNNTPVLNPAANPTNPSSSDFNFQDVIVIPRYGTQTQSVVPGFAEILEEIQVGVSIEKNLPATRTIVDPNVDSIRIVLTIPQLQKLEDNGDVNGSNVEIAVDVQYNGGGFTTVVRDTFRGRTADQYQRDYRITLANSARPADIRVRRLTDDSNSSKVVNGVIWTSYTEIVESRLNYPNSALVALRVDAEQFSSIPTRAYRIRGRKVQIPSNGTVDSNSGRITYSGVWNGTFASARWTTDPAWCLWDLLVNSRFGSGDFLDPASLDPWSFYAASQYCSELVPDGFGGTEPRFSLNCVIQTENEAYDVINQLCAVFRAMPYWSSGSLTITQDRPTDPSYLFNSTNVVDGFTYSSSDLKTRPTVASVKYFDMDARTDAYEMVEDSTAIAAYGIVKTEINAFGCTSRGQAKRLGEWLLYTSRFESEVVNFTASIEAGVVVRPGSQIRISDQTRAGQRMGGRILDATTTTLTVDQPPVFAAGAQVLAILPNGTLETRNVSAVSGNVITCSAFSAAPAKNSVWVYQQPGLLTSNWRVLTVREVEMCRYEITAISQNGSKYAFIERDAPLQFRDITQLDVRPASPSDLQATEVIYDATGRAAVKIVVTWRGVPGIRQYKIRWREEDGNWSVATIARLDYEILDVSNSRYEIEVSAASSTYNISPPSTLSITVAGKSARPSDIVSLTIVPIDGKTALLSWLPVNDLDVKIGGRIIIKHTSALVDAKWGAGQEIVASASGNQSQKVVPLLNGTYMVKAEDDSGNRSVTAALAVVNRPTLDNQLRVATYRESERLIPFPGNTVSMQYDSTLEGLVLSGGTLIDSIASIDALSSVDEGIQYSPVGEYVCERTFDLGAVYDVDIERLLETLGIEINNTWDSRTDLIDSWSEVDGTNVERVGCSAYVRTTNDDPTGSPTWAPWSEFVNATIVGRGLQFKLVAYSDSTSETVVVKRFDVFVNMRRRMEVFEERRYNPADGFVETLTFDNPFYLPPTISVSLVSSVSAGIYPSPVATTDDVSIKFWNGATAYQDATYTLTATGFGRRII